MSRASTRHWPHLSDATREALRRGTERLYYQRDSIGGSAMGLRYLLRKRREARERLTRANDRALEQWHYDMAAHDVSSFMSRARGEPEPAPLFYDPMTVALRQRQAQDDFNNVICSIPLGSPR